MGTFKRSYSLAAFTAAYIWIFFPVSGLYREAIQAACDVIASNYNVGLDGGWYQFGFLIGAGSPILGFIGKRK